MAQSDPLVVRILNEYRAELLNRESQQFQEMAQRWLQVEDAVESAIAALSQEMGERLAAGEEMPRWKIVQLRQYQALLAQVEREMRLYAIYAEEVISTEQAYYAEQGLAQGIDAINAIYLQAAVIATDFNRLNVDAVQAMAGFASDGSPLRLLLRASYPQTTDAILTALVRSVALGFNPRRTARELSASMGVGLNRALTIARTEQMRALRAATLEQYRASEVVRLYVRLASKSWRTCIACLMADGKTYSLRTEFEEHPNGRCSIVPVVAGVTPVKWLTGREWFMSLDEAKQRALMGDGRYDLWKRGKFELERVIKQRRHPVWGNSLVPRPLRELAKGAN